jgi:hypothetical protein
MTRRSSGLLLVVFVWATAPGNGGLRAEDTAPEKESAFPFPIYHDPPGTGGMSVGSYWMVKPSDKPGDLPFSAPGASAYDPVTRPWALPLAKLLDPGTASVPASGGLGDGREDWLSGELLPPGRSLQKQTEGAFGSVTAQVTWRDPRDLREAPALDSPWKTDHSWKLPLAGPVFVFGQFGAAPDPVTSEEMKMQGKTGVGCKVPVPFGIDVQLRGGRSLSYNDPLGTDHGERSQVFVEVQCHCPLPGQLGLEYLGSAVPALTPVERDRINQDLGLALPVGDLGKLRLGAKHQWESTPATKSWIDGMQLYVGFELGGTSKQ